MILKLGFRNILRNKRRSIITCLIMGLGLAALIFADAFLKGLNHNMILSVTQSFLGEGQIHHKDFLRTNEIDKTIVQSQNVLNSLLNDPLIKTASPRVIAHAMISSPNDIVPIALYGIDSIRELQISPLNNNIIRGEYLDISRPMDIVIGEKLAQFLSIEVGDKVVITLAQAGTGVLTQEMFRISGIFKMKNKEMDSSLAFVNLTHAQTMMNLKDSYHEIAFKFNNLSDTFYAPTMFLNKYSKTENQALSWRKLVPAIDAGIELTKYSLSIGTIILFIVIALTTMNTLFMSLYERMYEFGILKAIGTRSIHLFYLILTEAMALGIMSAILGIAVGGLVTTLTHFIGIHHLTDVEYLGATIKEAIRPQFSFKQYTLYPLAIIIFAVIASIYPAINASQIIPAKSIKNDK